MKPLLSSRKFGYSVVSGLFILAGLAICGYFHIPDLTGASALAAIGAAFGLAVHHQGGVDKIEAGKKI